MANEMMQPYATYTTTIHAASCSNKLGVTQVGILLDSRQCFLPANVFGSHRQGLFPCYPQEYAAGRLHSGTQLSKPFRLNFCRSCWPTFTCTGDAPSRVLRLRQCPKSRHPMTMENSSVRTGIEAWKICLCKLRFNLIQPESIRQQFLYKWWNKNKKYTLYFVKTIVSRITLSLKG